MTKKKLRDKADYIVWNYEGQESYQAKDIAQLAIDFSIEELEKLARPVLADNTGNFIVTTKEINEAIFNLKRMR